LRSWFFAFLFPIHFVEKILKRKIQKVLIGRTLEFGAFLCSQMNSVSNYFRKKKSSSNFLLKIFFEAFRFGGISDANFSKSSIVVAKTKTFSKYHSVLEKNAPCRQRI